MRSRFVRRWIAWVSIGEACGFAVAAAAGVLAEALRLGDAERLVLLVAAGAVEGAALATGQHAAMERDRPRRAAWVGATAAAASLAWLLGMLPSTVGLPEGPWTVVLLVVGGVVLLATIPVAQWLVLRRPGAGRWVPVSMGAWLVAILWTAAPSPFVDESSPVLLVVALYVVAGALMAVTVAALTAPLARSLFAR
ncbi:hypothetical protein ACIQC8_00755 [Agrococcus sediminis]|uniref:hypothetical protein n=1 Tax=Agrococcus TaxID=46352 RepID=UPI000FE2B93B|nr:MULTISPECIES: hypothetical protein [unclassified Agrococcus]MDR7235232.1 hypothetical protein [Agrococcus sp. BE272]RWR25996.1 hypothetical protein D8Y24_00375 [Agrococcus lahaulensis]UOW01339.1 hypothetical protein MU522_02660 [Agrococcus sp. SCSIO52902]